MLSAHCVTLYLLPVLECSLRWLCLSELTVLVFSFETVSEGLLRFQLSSVVYLLICFHHLLSCLPILVSALVDSYDMSISLYQLQCAPCCVCSLLSKCLWLLQVCTLNNLPAAGSSTVIQHNKGGLVLSQEQAQRRRDCYLLQYLTEGKTTIPDISESMEDS